MNKRFEIKLDELKASGNFRAINSNDESSHIVDLSSNDYLGIAENRSLRDEFFSISNTNDVAMCSSASRLLSKHQQEYFDIESTLENLYKKPALLFNSGYHANTGIIPALCDKNTLIVADKLVHASIIDGILLSKSQFVRFRHNDYEHLESILRKEINNFSTIIVITESIFSMDGDCCDLPRLVSIKEKYNNLLLYIDEAHAVGVIGEKGLGLAEEQSLINEIDIIVGTFGKAMASMGAYAITNATIKSYLINHARSFIFSTSIPPLSCAWTKFVLDKIVLMDSERTHLKNISIQLHNYINPLNNGIVSCSQIVPLIIGNSIKTVEISTQLLKLGYSALPIRTPTVPPGTERIRFSLNANLCENDIANLITNLSTFL